MRRFLIHRAAAAAFTRAVATTTGPQSPPSSSSSSSGPSNEDIGSTAANVPAGFGMQRAPLPRNTPTTSTSSPAGTSTGQSPAASTKAPPSVTQSQAAALAALHGMMQKDTTCVRLHRELLNAIATGSDADAQDLAGALARHVARHQNGGSASASSETSGDVPPKTPDTKSSTSSVETAVKKGPSSSEMPPAPGDESLAAIADKTMSMAMKRSPSDPSSSTGASTESMIPLVDVGVLDTAFVDYFSDIVSSTTSPGSVSTKHDDVMHPTHAAASQSALNATDAPAVPETSPVEFDAEKAVSEILQVYLKFFAEDFTALKKEVAAAVCEATAECLALTSSTSSPTASDTKLPGSASSLSNSKGKSAMHQSKRTPNVAVHLTPPIATDAAAPAVLREMRQCCPLSVRGRRRPAGMSALKHTTDAKTQLVRFHKSSLFAGRLSDDDRARVMEEAETVRAKLAAKGNNDAAEDIETIVAELVDLTVDENLTKILADVATTNDSSDPNADMEENDKKSDVALPTAESVAAGGGMRCSVGVHDDYGDLFATTVIDPARLNSVMRGSGSQIPNTNSKSESGAEVKEQSVEVDVTKHFGDAVARRVNRWLSRPGAPVVPVGCVVQLRVAVSEPEA